MEGMYLNLIKGTYYKSAPDIVLNREKLKAFSVKSRARQGYPVSPLLSSILLEVLTKAARQEEEIKDKQIGKKEVKLFLFGEVISSSIQKI